MSIVSDIAAQVKQLGCVTIGDKVLNTAFPHPADRDRASLEFRIALAMEGVKPNKEQPTQQQQIDAWCQQHGFRAEWLPYPSDDLEVTLNR